MVPAPPGGAGGLSRWCGTRSWFGANFQLCLFDQGTRSLHPSKLSVFCCNLASNSFFSLRSLSLADYNVFISFYLPQKLPDTPHSLLISFNFVQNGLPVSRHKQCTRGYYRWGISGLLISGLSCCHVKKRMT